MGRAGQGPPNMTSQGLSGHSVSLVIEYADTLTSQRLSGNSVSFVVCFLAMNISTLQSHILGKR